MHLQLCKIPKEIGKLPNESLMKFIKANEDLMKFFSANKGLMELIKANEGLMKMFKARKVEHCEVM